MNAKGRGSCGEWVRQVESKNNEINSVVEEVMNF